MKNVESIHVKYHDRTVGTMVLTRNHQIAFSYDDTWTSDGFSISPFSLPLQEGVFVSSKPHFQGLFGVFADSLPDAWGQLLVDRLLKKQGVDIGAITALDRLAIVGSSGMGALTYEPEITLGNMETVPALDALATECSKLLQAQECKDLE